MKKHILLLLGILFLILQACTTDEEITIKSNDDSEITTTIKTYPGTIDRPAIKSRNKVVVRYKPHLTGSQRYLIRNQNHVKKHKTCSCGDGDLELWIIDNAMISVEEVVENLETDADVEGDYQLYFSIDNQQIAFEDPTPNNLIAPPGNRSTVNIAIIDTGIDYASFSKPFLYSNPRNQNCPGEVSGYNFVNKSPNVQDDAGHGTLVTKLITSKLDKEHIDYRVLPVKAFDENGRGSYWNIICAMNYVIHKQPVIDIVNMSFGWYIAPEEIPESNQEILKMMIDSKMRTTLFTASAGNVPSNEQPHDVDTGGNLHFPSGYDSANLLTVAGYNPSSTIYIDPKTHTIKNVKLADRSNYGTISIDMVAPFSGYFPISEEFGEPVGTSFSCAYTTARVADFFTIGSTPSNVKNELWDSAYTSTDMQTVTKEGKVIVHNREN
ncbi:subtilase family protein [Aquimarina sp. MAR_2010_214]|uniref:S8 family serine peptidase n=1 Tax=Aquimarina sp. MAR_2010_214 TaxID=1250026 RepID=UPI000C71360B|nr:S8 family serine peptidase [Aquimarina sp. MAR_2010_214]PKV51772.1 subtilase family protein [Aquimarina sp. MAR_2010_214]